MTLDGYQILTIAKGIEAARSMEIRGTNPSGCRPIYRTDLERLGLDGVASALVFRSSDPEGAIKREFGRIGVE